VVEWSSGRVVEWSSGQRSAVDSGGKRGGGWATSGLGVSRTRAAAATWRGGGALGDELKSVPRDWDGCYA
jgi:hypothetical protein